MQTFNYNLIQEILLYLFIIFSFFDDEFSAEQKGALLTWWVFLNQAMEKIIHLTWPHP